MPKPSGVDIYEIEGDKGFIGGKKITDPDVLTLIILLFIWFLMRGTQTPMNIGRWDFYMFLILIMFLLGNASRIWWRYMTPKLVCDPIHTTTFGYGRTFGIWSVFTMGDIDWGFKVQGHDGTIVVPTVAISQHGRNITLNTPVKHIDADELPIAIKRQIIESGYKPPFYRGYLSDIQLTNIPKVQDLIKELEMANKYANMLEGDLAKRLKTYENYDQSVTRSSEMRKKQAEPPLSRKIRDALRGREEI